MEEENNASNQSNKSVWIVIIVIALAVGFGAFYLKSRSKTEMMPGEEMMEGNEQTETSMMDESKEKGMSTDESMSMMEDVIDVEGGMFYFKPNEIKAKVGQTVKIKLTSVEGMHNFVLDEFNVKSKNVSDGTSTEFEFTPDKAGTFEFYCSVANHRQMGMVGKLIVSE